MNGGNAEYFLDIGSVIKSHAGMVYDFSGARSDGQAAEKFVARRFVKKFDGGFLGLDDAPVVIRDRFNFIDNRFDRFIKLVSLRLCKANRSNERIRIDRSGNNMHI